MFACAQAGCPDCLESLVRENEGLIHCCLQRQEIGGVAYDDLVQEGRIALWQSILHFDPGRGSAFSTYAWAAIRHQVWRAKAYADQSQGYIEVEEWLYLAGEAEAAWWRGEVHQALLEMVVMLPKRLGQVIWLAYGLGDEPPYTLQAIGEQLGLTGERVRQLRNEALLLLRLPAWSVRLRDLCAQDSRRAYQQAQRLNRAWLRCRRGRR